jgi:hypothetical protein
MLPASDHRFAGRQQASARQCPACTVTARRRTVRIRGLVDVFRGGSTLDRRDAVPGDGLVLTKAGICCCQHHAGPDRRPGAQPDGWGATPRLGRSPPGAQPVCARTRTEQRRTGEPCSPCRPGGPGPSGDAVPGGPDGSAVVRGSLGRSTLVRQGNGNGRLALCRGTKVPLKSVVHRPAERGTFDRHTCTWSCLPACDRCLPHFRGFRARLRVARERRSSNVEKRLAPPMRGETQEESP